MARKKTQPEPDPVQYPLSELPAHIDGVVVEGPYVGRDYGEVLDELLDGVHAALAESSLPAARATGDRLIEELLIMTSSEEGPLAAKEAALRFAATCLPYITDPVLDGSGTFGRALERLGSTRQGEDHGQ